jgi:hypothetical protein
VARGEMPTTVEAPWENVMIGVRKAVRRVEELQGRRILNDAGHLIRPKQGDCGVDIYVSTLSAGGGLQMTVAGLMKNVSAASACPAGWTAGRPRLGSTYKIPLVYAGNRDAQDIVAQICDRAWGSAQSASRISAWSAPSVRS